MIGKIRDMMNQAPPWVTYAVVGVVLVLIVGGLAWQVMPGGGPKDTDKNFYFTDTEDGLTLSADKARDEMRAAAKANPGQPAMIKNPKSGKFTGTPGLRCPKCKAYFPMPEKTGGLFPTAWRDVCPKCGFSEQRDQAVQAAIKQKKEGKYDPNRIPTFMREDIEKALGEGGGAKK
jgi:hypothetical protein